MTKYTYTLFTLKNGIQYNILILFKSGMLTGKYKRDEKMDPKSGRLAYDFERIPRLLIGRNTQRTRTGISWKL